MPSKYITSWWLTSTILGCLSPPFLLYRTIFPHSHEFFSLSPGTFCGEACLYLRDWILYRFRLPSPSPISFLNRSKKTFWWRQREMENQAGTELSTLESTLDILKWLFFNSKDVYLYNLTKKSGFYALLQKCGFKIFRNQFSEVKILKPPPIFNKVNRKLVQKIRLNISIIGGRLNNYYKKNLWSIFE